MIDCLIQFVPGVICPCVFRYSPRTVTFDGNIINASHYFKETLISKMSTPRISNQPEFGPICLSIPHNRNIMYNICIVSMILKNSISVIFKSWRNRDTASYRSSLVYLLQHGRFTLNFAILLYLVHFIVILCKTLTIHR